jgi:hypothetical protein
MQHPVALVYGMLDGLSIVLNTIAHGPKSSYVTHANLTKFSRIASPIFWLFSGWNCVA